MRNPCDEGFAQLVIIWLPQCSQNKSFRTIAAQMCRTLGPEESTRNIQRGSRSFSLELANLLSQSEGCQLTYPPHHRRACGARPEMRHSNEHESHPPDLSQHAYGPGSQPCDLNT